MKKVDFNPFAEDYNALLRAQTGFFSADDTYFARYKVAIARRLAQGRSRRVLEIGCGIGRNIPFLCAAFPGSEVVGSDISEQSLVLARAANHGVEFLTEAELERGRIDADVVLVAGVVHHVPPEERADAIGRFADQLSHGGIMVVFEHNPYNPVTRRIVSGCPFDEGVILVHPRVLRRHLRNAGLTVTGQGYTLFFPPKFKRLAVAERMLAWLPLGGQYWVCATRT